MGRSADTEKVNIGVIALGQRMIIYEKKKNSPMIWTIRLKMRVTGKLKTPVDSTGKITQDLWVWKFFPLPSFLDTEKNSLLNFTELVQD